MDETTIMYAHRQAGRIVYAAEDPFPAPRPFERTAYSAKRAARTHVNRHRPTTRVVCMVAAIALAVVAVAGALGVANVLMGELGSSTQADAPSSTPKSAWKRGEVPFLFQTDPAWARAEYCGGTVAENGCGPTCLSMVYVALTGKTDRDPASMSAFSQLSGYAVKSEGTSWELFTDGAAKLGLIGRDVAASTSAVADELAAGHPLIASMRPGDFTTTGHLIVIAGVDEAGNYIVHDPNSPERSAVTWSPELVLGQCAALWSFSAA